ncbi:MAG: cistern family PEP-CTERM protein [Myxococcota bacterium]
MTVDSAGDSFTIDFGGNIEGDDVAGLTAQAVFEVESISGNTLVLDVRLTNTSSILWETARVSAFGFDTDPSIASASLDSTVFSDVNLGGSFSNGFGSIDLCVINNRNNCNGGGSGGLDIGEFTNLTLTLNFAGPISAVELDNFGVRYQSLSSEALGFDDDSGTGAPTTPIPEPRSTALFLVGGLLVAALARKQVLTTRS